MQICGELKKPQKLKKLVSFVSFVSFLLSYVENCHKVITLNSNAILTVSYGGLWKTHETNETNQNGEKHLNIKNSRRKT
jgi:hypothetical protein